VVSDVARFVMETLKVVPYSILWGFILFNLGCLTLLAGTAGRYSRGRILELHRDRISFVGVLVLVCVWGGFALRNNFPRSI
jgi:hypothetical protein